MSGPSEKLEIEKLLSTKGSLPSLPTVALNIIRLANDPDVTVGQTVGLLSKDPALSSRILRIVNSPLYVRAKAGGVESLKEAVVIMGLYAALNLSLSFSLVHSLRNPTGGGLDYELFWRRALLAGLSARVTGVYVGEIEMEELFLAGLLQDIGMMVIDRVAPGFYMGVGDRQTDHGKLIKYERKHMYTDHSQIGGLLLNKWHLPKRICRTVLLSHDACSRESSEQSGRFVRCVAFSGSVADFFLCPDKFQRYMDMTAAAKHCLELGEKHVQKIIELVADAIPGTEALFSTQLLNEESAKNILDEARRAWTQRVEQAENEVL